MKQQSYSVSKCIIVFSGFNQRAVIAFLRTITRHSLDYSIIAKSYDDSILLSKYQNKVLAIRKTSQLVLDDILLAIKEVQKKCNADEYIIVPSSEALNRLLLDNIDIFKQNRCIVPLVDKHVYELISNKYSFGRLCKEHGISIPNEKKFSFNMQLPVVAKPKEYFSRTTGQSLSPHIISNYQQLNAFYHKNNIDEFYFQEYIFGKCLYLLYCFTNLDKVFKFSQENIIQQENGKSIVYAISSDFHLSKESDKYEALFTKMNFRGLVMVEIKQRDSENIMIEANPRFWGPSQLFVDAGVNLFEAWLYDIGILTNMPCFEYNNKITKYFWFGGIIDNYKKQQQLYFYSCTETDLMDCLPSYLQFDVYRRPDTIEIFKKELIYGIN